MITDKIQFEKNSTFQNNTWVEISKKELLSLNDCTCVGISGHLYIFGGTEKLNSVNKVVLF